MTGPSVPCPLCDETFWNDEELRVHVDNVHGILGGSDVRRRQNARRAAEARERSLRRLGGGGRG